MGIKSPKLVSRFNPVMNFHVRMFFNKNLSSPSSPFLIKKNLRPWSLTVRPWKMLVGRQSFPIGMYCNFSGKLAVKLQGSIKSRRFQVFPSHSLFLPGFASPNPFFLRPLGEWWLSTTPWFPKKRRERARLVVGFPRARLSWWIFLLTAELAMTTKTENFMEFTMEFAPYHQWWCVKIGNPMYVPITFFHHHYLQGAQISFPQLFWGGNLQCQLS